MVEVSGQIGGDGVIQAALDLARATREHLTCWQVSTPSAYLAGDSDAGINSLQILVEADVEAFRDEQAWIEAVLAPEDVSWDWIHREGDPVQAPVSEARLADVIVISQGDERSAASQARCLCGALALSARTPVIVVPSNIQGFAVAGSAMVAWNGSREAALALRAALPLLALAEAVDVVTIDDDEDFPAVTAGASLSRHGIHADLITRTCAADTVAT